MNFIWGDLDNGQLLAQRTLLLEGWHRGQATDADLMTFAHTLDAAGLSHAAANLRGRVAEKETITPLAGGVAARQLTNLRGR